MEGAGVEAAVEVELPVPLADNGVATGFGGNEAAALEAIVEAATGMDPKVLTFEDDGDKAALLPAAEIAGTGAGIGESSKDPNTTCEAGLVG